jgi:hypothetical protein
MESMQFKDAINYKVYVVSVTNDWKCTIGEMVLAGKLKRSNRRKTCTSAILSTKNPTRTGLELNPDLSCAIPATNNLLYTHTIGTMPGLYVHLLYICNHFNTVIQTSYTTVDTNCICTSLIYITLKTLLTKVKDKIYLFIFKFKVCKSVHHYTIRINHHLDAKISPVYYPDDYLQLNMFRASSRSSSGAQQLQ